MQIGEWPALVQECLRITRPGGILLLTECERGISTSPALEELTALWSFLSVWGTKPDREKVQ